MNINSAETKDLAWEYPPRSLLEDRYDENADPNKLKKKAEIIEDVFKSCNLDINIIEVNLGFSVTQFVAEIPKGTKFKEIDLIFKKALAPLHISPDKYRLEYPIPKTTNLGIEIVNRKISVLNLKNLLSEDEIRMHKSKLVIPLGLNSIGDIVIYDIAKCSVLAVCGKKGSGKTTFLCTLVESLLFRNKLHTLKLILIGQKDSKILNFESIPHLLYPTISDTKKAVLAINWCHNEMVRRFKLIYETGVKSVSEYNNQWVDTFLPNIVVVIDGFEGIFGDISKVEKNLKEITRLGKKAGIFLIISNRKPISMLSKTKDITKIVFEMANKKESLAFLNKAGAEKLLGNGDMLFFCPGKKRILRIQAPFISDTEINNLTTYLKNYNFINI